MIEYYKHTCACGCGGLIKIKPRHKYDGTPKYLCCGCNARVNANRDYWKEFFQNKMRELNYAS